MNTLKFTKRSEVSTEQHNLEVFRKKSITIFGKNIDLYVPNNLSLFVTNSCNCSCFFCINSQYTNLDIDDNLYYQSLTRVLDELNPDDFEIIITGGEPTLHKERFVTTIQMCHERGFRFRTITTNGSGLFNIQDGDTILNNLIKYHWDHLNISRTSYDDTINKKIMRYEKDSEYSSMADLKRILDITNKSPLKHRISCLLLKESVNSVKEIKKYVDEYRKVGANNFIFRELMDYDYKAVNKEKIEYCNANKIKLNDIWEDFEQYPELKPYLNILGYYYYVEIYKYKGCTIASESADLNQQYIEKEKNPDTVYEIVFHTNGNLCAGWIDHEEILDQYQG